MPRLFVFLAGPTKNGKKCFCLGDFSRVYCEAQSCCCSQLVITIVVISLTIFILILFKMLLKL